MILDDGRTQFPKVGVEMALQNMGERVLEQVDFLIGLNHPIDQLLECLVLLRR